MDQGYFSTPAPIVVGNHVLVGTGNDIDSPGFLQSFDPETGELQWKHYTVPMKKGDPGLDTWASLDAARHGGAQTWIPGAYDPETKLYIFGTGNPTPAYTTGTRGEGDNLFTCALIAVNVDTGKMAWYFQTSPHDMHDYDSAQTPVLVDAMFNGKMRKLVLTAARNGYYFTLDRVTGEHLVTSKYGTVHELGEGSEQSRRPEARSRQRMPRWPVHWCRRTQTAPSIGSRPPSRPIPACCMSRSTTAFSIFYLTDVDPRGSMGLGGKEEAEVGSGGSLPDGHRLQDRQGCLAASLLQRRRGRRRAAGDRGRVGVCRRRGGQPGGARCGDGKPLWNTRIGEVTNAPQTYHAGWTSVRDRRHRR